MALIFADRVKETSATTGTGTMTLAGAVTGFQTFGARMADGDTCYYCITDGTDWEIGFGTLGGTETTLARTAVIYSSNADAAVNWTAATEIFITYPSVYPANSVLNENTVNDNRIVRFDGTSGLVIQESLVAIDDSGNFTGVGNIALSGTVDGRDIAADGALLDTAVQPGDLAAVATSGDYADLSNKPDLSVYDEVEQAANLAGFPGTGDVAKFYLAQDTGLMYRWNGSSYTVISAQLALGETSSTAYRGDRGKTAYDHSQVTTGNPHSVSKADVGLGNADNTSDANKPVSTAQQTEIDTKLDIANYSTSEHDTGIKWTDGKTIYRKVITGVTCTIGATVNTAHGISIDTPISFKGFFEGSNTTFPVYFNSTTFISGRLNQTNISTALGSGVATGSATVIIEYTKV